MATAHSVNTRTLATTSVTFVLNASSGFASQAGTETRAASWIQNTGASRPALRGACRSSSCLRPAGSSRRAASAMPA